MRELLKAAMKTGAGFMGSLLLGMLAIKIMAVMIGPSGVGLFSLLRQTQQTASGIGTCGGQTALVQGLASRDRKAQDAYIVTVFYFFLIGTVFITAAILGFAPWIAPLIFSRDDEQTISLFRWLAVPVLLGIALAFLNGMLNGFRAIGSLAWVQVIGYAILAMFAYPVSRIVQAGCPIALVGILSLSLMGSVAFSLYTAYRAGWLQPLFTSWRSGFNVESLHHFLSIAGPTFVTGLLGAITLLVVRILIAQKEGMIGAGLFDVAWTLSMMYVTLILISFSTYYLPTLTTTIDTQSRIVLMQNLMRIVIVIMPPLVTAIIVFKPLIIELLYSKTFQPSIKLIRWMLIGDYLRVSSCVFSFPMLAYADMKAFFWADFIWQLGFLSMVTISLFTFSNLQGVGVSFILISIFYFSYNLYYACNCHQFPLNKKLTIPWLLGLVLIIGASLQTWSDTHVNFFSAPLWIVVSIIFSWLTLSTKERCQVIKIVLNKRDLRL